MKKEFTIQVPDQWWVDCWEKNNTITWTYEGPEKLYVKVRDKQAVLDWSEELFDGLAEGEDIEELDANDSTAVVFYFVENKNPNPPPHEFEDELNFDGSIYKKILNPRIQELFYIDYDPINKFKLMPIYKSLEHPGTQEAAKKLAYIKKYTDLFEFDGDTQRLIDKFVADSNEYLEKMKTVYPWKFDKPVEISHPKIPVALVEKFQSLPTDFGGTINE